MVHSVRAVGYYVRSPQERSFFYTGDTDGDGLADTFGATNPDLVIVETTFPNSQQPLATLTHHMTPAILERELHKLEKNGGRVPRIIVVHMDVQEEDEIVSEISQLGSRLGMPITVAYEGMIIEV